MVKIVLFCCLSKIVPSCEIMFPNLGYLLRWLTGWNVSLPIPTFGFCMALSFWAAYAVFTLELRRKQRLAAMPDGLVTAASGGIPRNGRITAASGAISPDIRIGR